jgi:uncharacterized caspase-like protein
MKRFMRRRFVLAVMSASLIVGTAWAQPATTPTRANRHAVIIGVGSYADARISPLKGVVHDIANAKRIAADMGVPEANMRVLQDQDATQGNIRRALRDLATRVRDGDRVFIYYSGHGTRYVSPENPNVCREALIPSDVDLKIKSGLLTQEDIASDLAPVYAKADKVFIFFDACHSGGVQATGSKRSIIQTSDGEELSPKFSSVDTPAICGVPSNVRTRSVNDAARSRGAPSNNVVQLSSSRPDEISLDSPTSGGLATSAWNYCSIYADDTDGSGSLSIAEIALCVQGRMNTRLSSQSKFTGQHLVVAGNKEFAPVQTKPLALNVSADPPATAAAARAQSPAPVPPAGLAIVDAGTAHRFPLESIVSQRDERHVVSVQHTTGPLKIGRDYFELLVKSSRGGYVYLVLQSSDNESTYVLFPNSLDQNNRIGVGEWLSLPRPSWRLQSQGPAGKNKLLVMVADSPRDLSQLRVQANGPFVKTLNDRSSAQSLTWLVGTSVGSSDKKCASEFTGKDLTYVEECSDSFGATLIDFMETR